ncbi:MAG: efflux transporter outer membrane subunit [Pirellulaceae bacterium]
MTRFQSFPPTQSRIATLVLLAFLICGCRVGPEYCPPQANYMQQDWSQNPQPRLNGEPVDLAAWWYSFNDPGLNQLVDLALTHNLDLKQAGQRIQEARALRNVVAGNLYPQHQTANGGFANSRLSQNSANFFSFPGVFQPDLFPDSWNAGFAASWELDFWGQYRRSIESADAQVDSAIASADLARVLLLGELASNYIEMRTIETRINLANENVNIQRKTLELTEKKFEAGTISELDVHQAKANLAQTQSTVPALEILRRQAGHRICVLLGRTSFDLQQELGWTAQIPAPAESIAAGVPLDLLRRRPDIRIAERELAAQCSRIGIAKADFYPHISLNGSVGVEAEDLSRLFESASIVGSVGPQFSWKILNYGRLTNKVAAEQAAFERLQYAYHNAIIKAHQEAEDAQVAYCQGFDRVDALVQAVEHSSAAVDIAQTAFDEGATDFNRVYLLQSDLVRQQDSLAVSKGEIAKSLVALFVSMGGGWDHGPTIQACQPSIQQPTAVSHSTFIHEYDNGPQAMPEYPSAAPSNPPLEVPTDTLELPPYVEPNNDFKPDPNVSLRIPHSAGSRPEQQAAKPKLIPQAQHLPKGIPYTSQLHEIGRPPESNFSDWKYHDLDMSRLF